MAGQQAGDDVQGWILDCVVGSGSFATVWKAHKQTGDVLSYAAVKIIATERLSPKLKQSLECEVSILKRIKHTNVVKLHDVAKAKGCLYLVMEYCGGGDMAEYIQKHRHIPEATARSFIQQLAAGLKAMWQSNFVHRDLKPQNLLLSDSSGQAMLKIADFGFARDLQPQRLADTLCGSPLYMAPEILQSQKYDAKADLWSVGVILYELLIGHTPFDGWNHIQLLRNIERNEARISAADRAKLSPQSCHLIHCLLKRNPIQRISFEEFFSHPFVRPGSLLPDFPTEESHTEMATSFAGRLPTLPTIASSMALASTSSGEEQLPFAVETHGQGGWSARTRTRVLHRVESEPPTPAARGVVVRQPQQFQNAQPIFQNLRASRKLGKELAQTSLSNSLEDEDDYVIIERTPSSGGPRGYSQSAPTSSLFKAQNRHNTIHVPSPPPPLSVPLLVQTSMMQAASPIVNSQGILRFTAGLPQAEALQRVGFLLEEVAGQRECQAGYADSLTLRLLSLQVLQHVLSKQSELVDAVNSKASADMGVNIPQRMTEIAEGANHVAEGLRGEGGLQALPDVWEVTYRAALAFAKAAAVDEMLGNLSASVRAYAKAGTLLYFMSVEGQGLTFEPTLQLDPPDLHRLQQYMACISLRHQGCAERLKGLHLGRPIQGSMSSRRSLIDKPGAVSQ